jgi:hypothetical protein
MIEIEETDETRTIVAQNVRLRFRWSGDRWSHAFEIGPESSVFAESVEGNPDRDDQARVVSPTYQELHFQTDGPRAMALLVGRSGPHHFSAVFTVQEFEAEDADNGRRVVVEIDLADRCRSPITALAATYQVQAKPADLMSGDQECLIWRSGIPAPEFIHLEARLSRVSLAESGRLKSLAQVNAPLDPNQMTHRLIYLWRLGESSSSSRER